MGTQLLPRKRHSPHPIFGLCLLWPNGWINQDATWYGGKPRPRRRCVRWRDWSPSSPLKGAQPQSPVFGPSLLWPNGWMDEDAAWYGSRPRPRPHCVRRGPIYTRERGTAAPPFSAHVYCGHGRPSQLLLSSCTFIQPTGSRMIRPTSLRVYPGRTRGYTQGI